MIQKDTRIKIFTIQILLVCAMVSCSKKETIQEDKHNNQLNVKELVMGFFNNMSENDTLYLYENLSQCLVRRIENCIFTKENGDIYISTQINSNVFDCGDVRLSKTKYQRLENDTVNFENYLLFLLKNKYIVNRQRAHILCGISLNKYKISFHGTSLDEIADNSAYYKKVMHEIYPKEERYIPFELVIVPMPADTSVTLLDIVNGN